jgi:hypothetical protein
LYGGAIAFVTSIAAQWLICDYWLRGSGLRLADPSVAAIAVALFVRHLRETALRNRRADLRRFTVIREMIITFAMLSKSSPINLFCQIDPRKLPARQSRESNGCLQRFFPPFAMKASTVKNKREQTLNVVQYSPS